tara:strand:+ start:326 stop:541 length:216 start_codon:yes stop_codon:yes gene_type:complete
MGNLSPNKMVVTPESWDDIQEFIETFEHQAHAVHLAMMVYNHILKEFSKFGGYSFSAWKQEYLKDVKSNQN